MNVINNLGAVAIFFTLAFLKIFRPKQLREIIQQVFYIGARVIEYCDAGGALYRHGPRSSAFLYP